VKPFIANAITAVAAVTLVASVAISSYAQASISPTQGDPAYFDLGFTISALPRDSVGAKNWLATQTSDAQRVILAACDNYVKHPIAAEMAETIPFCSALLVK
jgi:hypothetical protein